MFIHSFIHSFYSLSIKSLQGWKNNQNRYRNRQIIETISCLYKQLSRTQKMFGIYCKIKTIERLTINNMQTEYSYITSLQKTIYTGPIETNNKQDRSHKKSYKESLWMTIIKIFV
jgi:hypothetical protein